MSAFNIDLNVADLQIIHEEGSEVANLLQVVGLAIPIGPQQAGVIGIGTVNAPLDREKLEKIVNEGQAILDSMPKKVASNLVIAGDVSQAEKFGQELKGLTGK